VLDAESHLRVAVRADPDWPCALERLAWYESDRGAATEALALWQRCDPTAEITDYVRTIAPFATTPAPKTGRNEPCWCGSGRKFKTCHLGRPVLAPLPDRVGWLYCKAATYLRHRGGSVVYSVVAHAAARVADPEDPESIREAVHDPLMTDAVLHEGGWFERFMADRGPLLPADKAILAGTWALAQRSVYEVLDAHSGSGLMLLDLLDSGDGVALLSYVAELSRSPRLVSSHA
jgi:SEC-C motif-containing protein